MIFLRDAAEAEWVIPLVGSQLGAQGQSLNEGKVELNEIGSVSFGSGSAAEYVVDGELFDDPAGTLERLAEAEDPCWCDPHARPSQVKVRPHWHPRPQGVSLGARDLSEAVGRLSPRGRPTSWSRGLDSRTDARSGRTVDRCKPVAVVWQSYPPRDHVSPTTGVEAYEKAGSVDRVTFAPLANELLVVAGHSDVKRRKRRRQAIEAADFLPDLDAKRSALAALEGGGLGQQRPRRSPLSRGGIGRPSSDGGLPRRCVT